LQAPDVDLPERRNVMPWWYAPWDFGPWFIFGIVMCFAMMGMMMLMGRGHMGGMSHIGPMGHMDGRENSDGPHIDPALETLRQRFASGELTKEEYEEERKTLLTV
jgi:uncharacterized membrane protein